MRVGIVGASSSGLYTAILLKKSHPDFQVDVFDKEEKIGKKLRATGNGHCNLLNMSACKNDFNHPEFIQRLLHAHPVSSLIDVLSGLGVSTKNIGDLLYPECFSAPSYAEFLAATASKLGVRFHMASKIDGYHKTTLISSDKKFEFDRLVFACGGVAQPNLGSDGSLFGLFGKHGYDLVPFQPGLAPIRVKENVKMLQGVRHDAYVRVTQDKKVIFEEEGELLFKKDGLSGIVIFNAQRAIVHLENKKNVEIHVNLFPAFSKEGLMARFNRAKKANPDFYLDSLFEKNLKEFLLKTVNAKDSESLVRFVQDLVFHFDAFYGFDAAQISCGGIAISNVKDSLESNLEPGVYFVGEALDIDGKCGGYNLTWCLLSSIVVSEAL